jgi:small conductance mechanosensitive channel
MMKLYRPRKTAGRKKLAGLSRPCLLRTVLGAWLVCVTAAPPSLAQTDPATPDDALARVEAMRSDIARTAAEAAGDEKDALAGFVQLQRRERELGALLEIAIAQVGTDPDGATAQRLKALVAEQFDKEREAIKQVRARMDAIRTERAAAPEDKVIEFEYRLRDYDQLLSDLLRELLDNAARAEQLGLDATEQLRVLDEILIARADMLSDRIALTRQRISTTRERSDAAAGDQKSALENELAALEERKERIKFGLEATVDLLRERGRDVSKYVQLLIQTTGEISGDIFDSKVIVGLVDDWMSVIRQTIAEEGPGWIFKILIIVVLIAIFKILANIVGRMVRRAVSSSKMNFSSLLQDFFVSASSNAVLLLGLLIALSQLGVKLGPVLAGLGVAGFILGFALQETLSNFASGMMILIYRPFDVGDVVEAGGVSGKVDHMSLVSTTILTFDNQKLVVPNNKIWGDVIRNVNAAPYRRVDMTFGIGYGDDIAKAENILQAIIAEHDLVLEEPAPTIKLHTLGESSVDFIVRPWVNAADYWTVYWDVTRAVKERFDAEGVTIPFPQRDVHLYQARLD